MCLVAGSVCAAMAAVFAIVWMLMPYVVLPPKSATAITSWEDDPALIVFENARTQQNAPVR